MRYKVPKDIIDTIRSGLELFDKEKPHGLEVPLHIARSLFDSGEASEQVLRKINRYTPRTDTDKIALSLWGGAKAKEWSRTILESTLGFSTCNFSDSDPSTVRVSQFSIEEDTSYIAGDYRVYPSSYLFESGNFKDKKIEITDEDLALRVANSVPSYGNLEHEDLNPDDPTIGAFAALDGEVGYISKFWIDADKPNVARGEVHIPLWLDKKLDKKGISMEVPFTPGEGFSGFALTYSPRISRAALMSQVVADFKKAKSYTSHGLRHASELHNTLVNMGAVCSGDTTKMSSSHEQKIAQGMHDQLVSEGMVQCATIPADKLEENRPPSYYYSKGKTKMPLFSGLKNLIPAWFTAGQPDEFEIPVKDESGTILTIVPVPVKEEVKVDFKDTPEYAQFTKELETAKLKTKELEDEKAVKFAEDAAKFAADNKAAITQLKTDDKILPEQEESLAVWRAKDPVAFDAHFANMPKLGNVTVTVDANDVAATRNKTVSLSGPSPEDVMKEVLAMAKARGNE